MIGTTCCDNGDIYTHTYYLQRSHKKYLPCFTILINTSKIGLVTMISVQNRLFNFHHSQCLCYLGGWVSNTEYLSDKRKFSFPFTIFLCVFEWSYPLMFEYVSESGQHRLVNENVAAVAEYFITVKIYGLGRLGFGIS